MKRSMLVALLLFMLAPLMTSCLGLRQINELAIVTAVGLEIGSKPENVKVSVQIIRPSDARGQTGAPSGGTGEPIYSVSAEGRSIFDAIRNLGRFSSRRVYWAHNFLIVMHESYARKGIRDMVDFFTRNHELRMNTWVAVTPDSPEEIVSTITGLEVVPGEALDRLFRSNDVASNSPASNMMKLEEAFQSRSTQPILARLQLVPRGISNKKPEEHGSINQVELSGAAVFRDERMIDWLSGRETRVVMFFLERLKSGIEVVNCPNSNDRVALEFQNAQLKITPNYREETAQFDIRLRASADIVESGCGMDLSQIRAEIESNLEQLIKSRMEDLIHKAQKEYRADFLKLGDVFRNKYPYEWRSIGANWNSVFAEADIQVQVHIAVKSTVIKAVGTGLR